MNALTNYPLASLLAKTEPLAYCRIHNAPWIDVFAYIDQHEYQQFPAQWGRFLDSVRARGILFPVEVVWRHGRLRVRDGHHRIWAAHRLGLLTIPVIEN